MLNFIKDISLQDAVFPFGAVLVKYPEQLDKEAFYAFAQQKINQLKEKYTDYDRKAVWADNKHYRFFKKFKKTYPVMLQFESVTFKDRPFPAFNPISEVAFLLEITTFALSGTHDISKIDGDVMLYIADKKEDFMGMRDMLHTYPNDFCARDNSGIIFSMIAGTDSRTCATPDSRNVLYPIFCTPDADAQYIETAAGTLAEYIKVLAPTAEIEIRII